MNEELSTAKLWLIRVIVPPLLVVGVGLLATLRPTPSAVHFEDDGGEQLHKVGLAINDADDAPRQAAGEHGMNCRPLSAGTGRSGPVVRIAGGWQALRRYFCGESTFGPPRGHNGAGPRTNWQRRRSLRSDVDRGGSDDRCRTGGGRLFYQATVDQINGGRVRPRPSTTPTRPPASTFAGVPLYVSGTRR